MSRFPSREPGSRSRRPGRPSPRCRSRRKGRPRPGRPRSRPYGAAFRRTRRHGAGPRPRVRKPRRQPRRSSRPCPDTSPGNSGSASPPARHACGRRGGNRPSRAGHRRSGCIARVRRRAPPVRPPAARGRNGRRSARRPSGLRAERCRSPAPRPGSARSPPAWRPFRGRTWSIPRPCREKCPGRSRPTPRRPSARRFSFRLLINGSAGRSVGDIGARGMTPTRPMTKVTPPSFLI